ncbi:MAG: hypothetical protein V7754_08880 [Halioglobus sp.]
MKKLLSILVVMGVSSAGYAAEAVDIPEDILKKQRLTLQHYGSVSITQVSEEVAKGYSYRIKNMIKSLTQSKARFDKQITPGPANPYAKYNGVWRNTLHSTTYNCDNGQAVTLPSVTFEIRWVVGGMGRVTEKLTAIPPTDLGFKQLELTEYEHRIYSDRSYRYRDESYNYAEDSGYYTAYNTTAATMDSNSSFTGNTRLRFIYHDHGVECEGNPRFTGIKISN